MNKIALFGLSLCVLVSSNEVFAQVKDYDTWKKERVDEFYHVDLNKDGKWTSDEYMQALDMTLAAAKLDAQKIPLIKEKAKEMHSLIDDNNDGSVSVDEFSSKVTYEKIQNYINSHAEHTHETE